MGDEGRLHIIRAEREALSPVLTRELLYTAVTPAEQQVTLVGTEDALRAAVSQPIPRASGLRAALWDTP